MSKVVITPESINVARSFLPAIQEANQKLFEHFQMFLLTYRRFYKDGRTLYLFGTSDWLEKCFEKEYITSYSFAERWKKISSQEHYQFIFPESVDGVTDQVYQNLFDMGLWHGFILYKNRGDCLDAYCFITERERTYVRDFYYNYPEVLEHYISHLMVIAQPALKKPDARHFLTFQLPSQSDNTDILEKIDSFQKALPIKKHYLRINGEDVLLSEMEYRCFKYLKSGLTHKQIASHLSISPRSVETYLKRLRDKTNLLSNHQLIAF